MTKATLLLLSLSMHCLLVAADWGSWTDWSGCKCDQTETRSRQCLSEPCSGPEAESRPCTCTQIDLQDKCSHVCLGSNCVSGYVADPCDCSCFYHCVKAGDQWTAIQQCCNLCEVWDDYVWTCVRDYNDPNCTFSPTTETAGPCPLSPGSSKTTFLLGGTEVECAPDTEYSQAACACVNAPPAVPRADPITCITFDQPHPYGALGGPYVQEVNMLIETDPNICTVSGNCGYFNSSANAHLEIPYFNGNQFREFAFSFWYRRTPSKGSLFMGLVNNGNCEMEATIALVSDNENSNCGWLETENGKFQKRSHTADDSRWHMYTMSYNGSYVSVYQDSQLTAGDDLTGMTKITHCPMTIGSFLCKDYFDGHMDSALLESIQGGSFYNCGRKAVQGASVAKKNDCWFARIRDRRSNSGNGCPLYPSDKCSGVQWGRAGDVYCVARMSTEPFIIVSLAMSTGPFIIVSLAMSTGPFIIVSLAMSTGPFIIVSLAMSTGPFIIVSLAMSTGPFITVSLAMSTGPFIIVSLAMSTGAFIIVSLAMSTGPFIIVSLAMSTGPFIIVSLAMSTGPFIIVSLAMSTGPFIIVSLAMSTGPFIIVSLAVPLRCSKDGH
ncbi:hypothetical protein LSAT2_000959 [Lamellibrachia satsuma]|nr:hypothetical protein LSAT2_000959 [Lamellibrachia satsuma]